MSTDVDMTPAQIRALKIYTHSANLHNDYKPKSFEQIAQQLKDEGFTASSSSVGRWAKKYNFKDHLDIQIDKVYAVDTIKKEKLQTVSRDVQTKLVDLDRNNHLTADCYELMELFTKQVAQTYDEHGIIKRDDIKIVKDIAVFTGGREDKFLDRLANSGDDVISSDELKAEFDEIDVEIEDE